MGDKARLRSDPYYLRCQLCEQFKKYDTYNRGLITAASFQRSLEDLGLRIEHEEVAEILRLCTITGDGYVHFKELIKQTSPEEPKAKKETPYAIYPEPDRDEVESQQCDRGEELNSNNPAAQRELIASRTHEIQRLYSRWDRGILSTTAFTRALQELNIPLSSEFRRLMDVNESSRNLPFAQLMSSLQINDFILRKARHPPVADLTPGNTAREFGGRKPSIRNPVTWTRGDEPSPNGRYDAVEKRDLVQRAVCDFCDDITDATVFAAQLDSLGVSVTPEIQRLIRTHESGNCVNFREFAAVIMRQGEASFETTASPTRETQNAGGELSYLPTPYATELTPGVPKLNIPAPTTILPNEPNLPQFHKLEAHRRSGRQHVERVVCQGDIIGWTGQNQPVKTETVPQQMWRNNNSDIITWGVNQGSTATSPKDTANRKCNDVQRRSGAPFGTDRDVGQPIRNFVSTTDVYRQAH